MVSSWGYPLQQLEVYTQPEVGKFGYSYEKHFVITENDFNYPYGFDKNRAIKIAQIYQSYMAQKFFLLILSVLCAGYALIIGNDTVINSEIDSEVEEIKATGRKQLLLEQVKHRLALASKSQRFLFIDEMKSLMEEFGSVEQDLIEADEINALYDQVNSDESELESNSLIEQVRAKYPPTADGVYWDAISKAMANGSSRDEILATTLNDTSNIGKAYLDMLIKQKMGA